MYRCVTVILFLFIFVSYIIYIYILYFCQDINTTRTNYGTITIQHDFHVLILQCILKRKWTWNDNSNLQTVHEQLCRACSPDCSLQILLREVILPTYEAILHIGLLHILFDAPVTANCTFRPSMSDQNSTAHRRTETPHKSWMLFNILCLICFSL